MTTPSLYQLTHEYTQLLHTLSDMDIDAQTVLDTIESTGLQESIAQRTQGRVFVIKSMRQHADMVDAEIKRLTKLKKHYEQRADALEESTLALLQSTGIHTIEGDLMVVKIRQNPPSVDVFDPDQVPAEYLRAVAPPPPAPDKTAIKDALKRGIDIPGARLVQTQRLAIA